MLAKFRPHLFALSDPWVQGESGGISARRPLYLGTGLTQAGDIPDDTEFLEVASFPFEQVLQMVLASEIRDSMTVIAVLHAARLREQVNPGK